jgi:hypothetical protein
VVGFPIVRALRLSSLQDCRERVPCTEPAFEHREPNCTGSCPRCLSESLRLRKSRVLVIFDAIRVSLGILRSRCGVFPYRCKRKLVPAHRWCVRGVVRLTSNLITPNNANLITPNNHYLIIPNNH